MHVYIYTYAEMPREEEVQVTAVIAMVGVVVVAAVAYGREEGAKG
jgi:hypothetical protein